MCDFRCGFLAIASITLLLSDVEEMSINRSYAIRFDPISSQSAFSLIYWHSFKYSSSKHICTFSETIVVKNTSFTLVPPIYSLRTFDMAPDSNSF
jgi:hypothetical protein